MAGEFRYVGKETDRKWEEGDDLSVLEFKNTEYGRAKKVVADPELLATMGKYGVRELMRRTALSQRTLAAVRVGTPVKRAALAILKQVLLSAHRDTEG